MKNIQVNNTTSTDVKRNSMGTQTIPVTLIENKPKETQEKTTTQTQDNQETPNEAITEPQEVPNIESTNTTTTTTIKTTPAQFPTYTETTPITVPEPIVQTKEDTNEATLPTNLEPISQPNEITTTETITTKTTTTTIPTEYNQEIPVQKFDAFIEQKEIPQNQPETITTTTTPIQ